MCSFHLASGLGAKKVVKYYGKLPCSFTWLCNEGHINFDLLLTCCDMFLFPGVWFVTAKLSEKLINIGTWEHVCWNPSWYSSSTVLQGLACGPCTQYLHYLINRSLHFINYNYSVSVLQYSYGAAPLTMFRLCSAAFYLLHQLCLARDKKQFGLCATSVAF